MRERDLKTNRFSAETLRPYIYFVRVSRPFTFFVLQHCFPLHSWVHFNFQFDLLFWVIFLILLNSCAQSSPLKRRILR